MYGFPTDLVLTYDPWTTLSSPWRKIPSERLKIERDWKRKRGKNAEIVEEKKESADCVKFDVV